MLRAPTCHYRTDFIGNAVAPGISNSYHPDYQRTFSNTINVWGTDILLNTLCNVAKEFWPDIRRAIHNRRTNHLYRAAFKRSRTFLDWTNMSSKRTPDCMVSKEQMPPCIALLSP